MMDVDEMRLHVETALDEEALQLLIDAAEADIVEWAGELDLDYDPTDVTETVRAYGLSLLRLRQVPVEIVTVTDTAGTTDTELVEADYRIRGTYLERTSGYRWGERTTVVYQPFDDSAKRRRALIALVKLAINVDPGLGSEGAGGWNTTFFGKDPAAEKARILYDLREPELFA